MTITFVGARDFEEQINSQVAGGNPPDIAIFPQPGKLRDFAASEDVFPLPDDVLRHGAGELGRELARLLAGRRGHAVRRAREVRPQVARVVQPGRFAEKGYEVPETFDAFFALAGEMIANGDTPLCVGIESGPATGWPFTDWTEEIILRNEGIDYYNQWVAHEMPFDDPPVVDAMAPGLRPVGHRGHGLRRRRLHRRHAVR